MRYARAMMTRLHLICLLVGTPTALVAQRPAELTPAVARLVKTYSQSPDGAGFFSVWAAAVELKSNGLWIRYGDDGTPPVRIDRTTGTSKVIGRAGSGPNEYRQTADMISGVDGTIGVRDVGRQLLFWVDQNGVQRRTWSLPTTSNMQSKTFTDMKGHVYIGTSSFVDGKRGPTMLVRVDSALGLRDTVVVPFQQSPTWSWSTRTANGATMYYVQYAPSPDWGIDRQGRLYAYWSDSSFIQIFDGKKSSRLLLPTWREPLTAADRKRVTDQLDQIEKREKARNAEFLGSRPAVPELRPQLLESIPELNGGIVVRRSRLCAAYAGWKAPISGAAPPDSGRCSLIERFDPSGKRLTPFTLTARDQLLAIRADTAWVARRDEDDIVKILELVIPRR